MAAGASETVTFEVTEDMLLLTGYNGDYTMYSGTHHFDMWRGNGEIITINITV